MALPGAEHQAHVPGDRDGDVRVEPRHQGMSVEVPGGQHGWGQDEQEDEKHTDVTSDPIIKLSQVT